MNIDKTLKLALKYLKAGELIQAENIYTEILKNNPNNASALHFIGVIYYRRKEFETAIAYIQRALLEQPHYVSACNNLGLVFQDMGQFDKAVSCFREAAQMDPNSIESHINLGNLLQSKGLLDEAMKYFEKALKLSPGNLELYNNIGNILHVNGMLDEAIAYFTKALRLAPEFYGLYNNLGIVLNEKGQFDEAISCFEKAIQLNPEYIASHVNLGNTLQAKGLLDEAIAYFQKVLQLDPGNAYVNYNLALTLLSSGDFKGGWEKYEWRREIEELSCLRTGFSQPFWEGSDLKGSTILLLGEQGFGDILQFVRYAPLVAQCNAKIILACHRELCSLLESVDGVHKVVPYGEELPAFDTYCYLLSLPFVFGTTVDSIPWEKPYVKVNSSAVQKWRCKTMSDTSKMKIGLVWSGNPKNIKLRHKSCPLDKLLSLMRIEDTTFYSLQKGEAARQAKNLPADIRLLDYSDELRDFSDTAAFIQTLDLVISVDTASAHLAGALGKPVWVLLPFVSDWRWMQKRKDSPWYPTMRLFRQPSPGDWESVISDIERELLKSKRNERGAFAG